MTFADDITVFNFTDVYKGEDFYSNVGKPRFIECSDIRGTDCFCDDIARGELMARMRDHGVPVGGIHFLDNGNYHYMTNLLTSMIQEPFHLIYFDHHPDLKESAFGDILSCGSWVRRTVADNRNLVKVVACGIDDALMAEIPEADRTGIVHIDEEHLSGDAVCDVLWDDLPVYISLDKDVLSPETVTTNWDQGHLSEKKLMDILHYLYMKKRILGMDVCGEPSADTDCDFAAAQRMNSEFNSRLLSVFR